MKKSFFFKIFSGYFFVILLITLLIVLFSFRLIRSHYIETLTDDLKDLGITMQPQIVRLITEGKTEELESLVKDVGEKTNLRITVIGADGVVLADSKKDSESMENHSDRYEIVQALETGFGTSIRFSETVREHMLYVALPLRDDGKTLGVVRISIFLKDIDILLGKLQRSILYIIAGIMLLAVAGSLFISQNISRPIRELSKAAKSVAEGDFTKRVFLKRNDDLKELSDRFNYMTDRISFLFGELSHQKDELTSIISSMREGLLVLNDQGRVVLSNESFMEMIGDVLVSGKYYWEVIREPELGEIAKKVGQTREDLSRELKIGDRVFLCSATFLKSKRETVLVFHDITDLKNIEMLKKEFVSNISHELRTPLTSIKGFLETVESGAEGEEKRRYFEIINRNTERLIAIVKDISLLSELEERGSVLQFERVDFRETLDNVVKIFDKEVKRKGLKLVLDVKKNDLSIMADPFKVEQLMINLLDNAIKYTNDGEITVGVESNKEMLTFTVTDTGPGIPKDDIPMIFSRFYRVDKSRSRELGGTGLGLSIVKNIVLLHNGDIKVESALGQGSTFIVRMPKKH